MTQSIESWMGWAGPEWAAQAREELAESFLPFEIVGSAESSAGKRVCLWEYAKRVNGGRHLPTLRQEIGDCVSFGAAQAIDYLACMEIARLNEREKLRRAFPPYIYGISRVNVGGGRISGDGSVGAWAADGLRKFGVLPADEPGVPSYSGDVAKRWGRTGPPSSFIEIAKPHLVRSTAPVERYEQVRDALTNGYPVTVASNQGFTMLPRESDGKSWGVPQGTWMHQMCFIAVDDDSRRPGCYCLNSWGPDAHGTPADDSPPGGFWVDAHLVDRMVGQRDSFALSQFEGFPAQRLDFLLI